MYIGRFVILGKTPAGEWFLGYRVSSRSFPNRRIIVASDRAVVMPTEDAPKTDNPYISYNCLRTHASTVVVGNGSQVDPVIDKIQLGYPLRDALALATLALDYEHDQYNTPRVTAGLDARADQGYLGIIAEDKLLVRRMDVAPGAAYLIATYECTDPTPIALAGDTPEALCDAIYSCEYELPVAVLAAMLREGQLRMAVRWGH
jgi:IMP cyclohydrolase